VSAQYRLNILGFAGSHELAPRDIDSGSTGNYGIQDQRAALAWVSDNIHLFGGDATKVMIYGESAGAGSVSMHLTMPRSFPLYSKAVIESGAWSYWTAQPLEQAESQFAGVKNATGCNKREGDTGKDSLACLLALDATVLVKAAVDAQRKVHSTYGCGFAPVADGVELTALPWDLRDEGKFNTKAPVMMGYNRDEGTIDIAEYPGVSANMTGHDFLVLLDVFTSGNETQAQEAAVIYAPRQTGGNRETKDYTSYYWSSTHISGDYGFSCPSRRTAYAMTKVQTSYNIQYD
jgi:carboxylesterase type B